MTIKFDAGVNNYLQAPDSAAQTFPATFSFGFFVRLDGKCDSSYATAQWLFSSGTGTNYSFGVVYGAAGYGICPNGLGIGAGSSLTPTAVPGLTLTAGNTYLVVVEYVNNVATVYTAPAQTSGSMPTDGSAVASYSMSGFNPVPNGPIDGNGLTIGGRSDHGGARGCDQSLARMFRYDGTLTKLEIAKLAYGMEITDLGYTPAWYVKMTDNTDIVDRGSEGNTFTAVNSPASGAVIPFAYTGSAPATVTSVAVSPSAPSVAGGGTQQFSATVTGTNNPAQTVTWSASAGSITSGGLFTAPAATSGAQTITVTATSTVDNTKSGTATVTVPATAATPTVSSVTVSPSAPTVSGGGTQQFNATVNGTNGPSQSVTWSASAGSITSGGLFTAPAATSSAQTITVTATSVADNTKSGTATVTVPSTAVNSVNDVTADTIFQRIGTSAPVALSGTYATAPTTIEAQLYASDGSTVKQGWTALTSTTISGGNWSGSLLANQGGMYRMAVRFKDGSGNVLYTSGVTTNLWGVGALFPLVGSSSAYGWVAGSAGTAPAAVTRVYSNGAWNNWSAGTPNITAFANGLASRLGVPVGIVPDGQSGTLLVPNWTDTSNYVWTGFVGTAAAVGNKFEAVLVTAGSNDAGNRVVVSRAQHAANLRTLFSNLRTLTTQPNLPIMLSGMDHRTSGVTDAQADYVHGGEIDVSNDANVYLATNIDVPMSGDNIHVADYTLEVSRMEYILGNVLQGNGYKRGPLLAGASYAGTTVTVALTHRNGTDITPTSGISGFAVTDDSGAVPLTSVTRADATHVNIVCGRAPTGTVRVMYQEGVNADVSAPLFDSGATMSLPMYMEPAGVVATNATGAALSGATAAQASATGALTTSINLAGAAIALAVATASLGGGGAALSGAGTAQASATGTLTTSISLAGSAVALAAASASLGGPGAALSGAAAAQATGTGVLTTSILLSGSAVAQASASAVFAAQVVALAGAGVAQSNASGDLTTSIPLAGASAAQSFAHAALTTSIQLAGHAVCGSSGSAILTDIYAEIVIDPERILVVPNPNDTTAPAVITDFMLIAGQWTINKDPRSILFYGVDARTDMALAQTTVLRVDAIPVGVTLSLPGFVSDPAGIVGAMVAGLDTSSDDAVNCVTFMFHCANTEVVPYTIYFRHKDQ